MIFKYEDEKAEYPTEEIEKLKEGECIGIDFNGRYLIEFEKTKSDTLLSTGRGMDGYGHPIEVKKIKVAVEYSDERKEDEVVLPDETIKIEKDKKQKRKRGGHSHPH